MKMEKLFNILVVGGALLTANSTLVAANEDVAESDGAPAFCKPFDPSKPPEQNTCLINEQGKQVVKPGFFCCWGTTCGEK